jgi:signal transduction histidine kinase
LRQRPRLLDDLLDVARITGNKLELRRERVVLADILRSATETSRPLIEAAGHELVVTLPPDSIHLDADPLRLAQVIANLLHNAAKYTDRGGRLWLTVFLEQQRDPVTRPGETQAATATSCPQVRIQVRDTGIGIPAALLPHVFEMFTRVNRSLDGHQGGLGIGLSLARRLVEMHGGTLTAHSDGAEQGSEFVVCLPVP